MKRIRIISAIMTIVMVIGVLANMSILPVFAAETDPEKVVKDDTYYRENYLTKSYPTAAHKIATMVKYLENDKYIFYLQTESAEWALQNKVTGQYIFSNPYNIGSSESMSEETKIRLYSQIIIDFLDSGVDKKYTSFKDCVMLNQIKVKNLKNGVRVEYAVGNEETRKLIPMQISKDRLESEILANIPEGRQKDTLLAFYQLKSLDDPTLTTSGKKQLLASYPIVEKFPIYVFSTDAGETEKLRQEAVIKTYCAEYSFEELEYDHSLVNYTAVDKAPAVFKFALEYSLTNEGVDVRLGANGIRFDETNYTLKNMTILPYVGAGSSNYNGYVFIPDGSGSLIRFEDVKGTQVALSGKLYGQDYAFHTITGSTQQIMRLPVYGVVETKYRTVKQTGADGKDEFVQVPVYGGFLAIVEEGDSLATIFAETGGTLHDYNTAYTAFNPRPSDQYSLGESGGSGSSAVWNVVSERKYTGSYRIKYVMLEDDGLVKDANVTDTERVSYSANYVGMANAYRDYLYASGQLTALNKDTVKENIPLYIEALGTIDTQKKILSFPVTVELPLTTFDDLMTIYSSLESKGINNINYRLTGFANGGMNPVVPNQVEFQKKVGGNKGYKNFLKYASEKNIGVYPDFDFVYFHTSEMFDGFSFRNDAVKTIDNRYTQKQEYDSVYQSLELSGNVVISVSAFSEFFDGLNKDLKKLGATSVSVSTLGSDLNSDFDEDNPYNREDSRYETVKVFKKLNENYTSIMSDAGNSYILGYVDHLLNVSLDSSRYVTASQSIPFMGMVLHGSVEFAGTPLNMTGNISYELLKMIENGSNPYFMLAYRNTAELKDDPLYADYFSVQYKIWEDDLVEYYNFVNEALKDVQTETIVGHEFLQGERVPTAEEKAEDEEALKQAQEQAAINKIHLEEKERRAAALKAKLEALKNKDQPADQTPETPAVPETPAAPAAVTEPEEEEELIDLKTKYLTQLGTVVKVTYSNGKTFILNYNSFDITVDGKTIEAQNYIVLG